MFRLARFSARKASMMFSIGFVSLTALSITLSGCTPAAAPTPVVNNGLVLTQPSGPTAIPSPGVVPATRTPYPVSGATLDQTLDVAKQFVLHAPEVIGRFTLDKQKSYGNPHGAALLYNGSTGGVLTVAFWLNANANDSVDRYSIETSMISAPKIPISLGDEAIVSPENKVPGPRAGVNPTVWGEMRYRNTLLILYADATLIQKMPDFSKDEATDLLTKLFAAVPKQ